MLTLRHDGRTPEALRPVEITRGWVKTSGGSVLYRSGDTAVLVTANLSSKVPPFLEGKGEGWLTAEYAMLPGSTGGGRKSRGPDGRSSEIQRLIGRSLRAVLDRSLLGPYTIHVDADVLQADGGTRTAAITAGMIAVADALAQRFGALAKDILIDTVAAVSVGIHGGVPLLDLDYPEDSAADVDLNVVRLGQGGFIEVQGTGERTTFQRAELNRLLDLAELGLDQLRTRQESHLAEIFPTPFLPRSKRSPQNPSD